MATVLLRSGARLRGRRNLWVRQLVSVLVAVVIAAVLCGMDAAQAQSMSADVPTSGVSWGNGPSATPATASVSGSSFSTTQQAVTSLALAGLAVAVPWTRVATVGASVMGAAGRVALQTAMSRGALTGAALAAALALTGDTYYDPNSNGFLYRGGNQPNGSNVDYGSSGWQSYNVGVGCTSGYVCTAQQACESLKTINWPAGNVLFKIVLESPPLGAYKASATCWVSKADGTNPQAWSHIGMQQTYSSNAPSVAATNAQIESAIAATPSSWTNLFNAAGCPQKVNTYIDLVAAASNTDPCAVIVTGGTAGPANVSPTNNPYGWPAKQWSEAYNGLTHNKKLEMSTAVSANTGTDAKANPVQVQTTAKVTDTSTDAAGNTTTNVTTTTAPAETKPADKTDDTTSATFNAGEADLYAKKSKTWNDVLVSFSNVVKGAPWYSAAVGFFNVSISGGACPHWTVAATKWTPVLEAGQYVCSQNMLTLYGIGGTVVLIVAAWAAFRIAFL